jgi:hypothetical protein
MLATEAQRISFAELNLFPEDPSADPIECGRADPPAAAVILHQMTYFGSFGSRRALSQSNETWFSSLAILQN